MSKGPGPRAPALSLSHLDVPRSQDAPVDCGAGSGSGRGLPLLETRPACPFLGLSTASRALWPSLSKSPQSADSECPLAQHRPLVQVSGLKPALWGPGLGWGTDKDIPNPNTAHKVPRGLQVPKGRSGGFPGARNTPQEMWQESILPQAPSPPGSPQACSLYLSRP